MTAKRDPDAIVRAWIDAGPHDLPDASRYAISTTARTLPQRRPRSVLPIALGGLAVAAAVIAVAVLASLPRPTPITDGSTTLGAMSGSLAITYAVPEGLELSVDDGYASPAEGDTPRAIVGFTQGGVGAYGWGLLRESVDQEAYTPGARGVVIADVTDMKLHGMRGAELGNDAATFLEVMHDSEWWDLRDVSETTVDGRPAFQGRPVMVEVWWTHLDTSESSGTLIELRHPSQVIVTEVGDTLLMIQIWAGTEEQLDAWIPTAMEFVDSIEISEVR